MDVCLLWVLFVVR